MQLDPGSKVGRYEVLSLLGAGGMAEVYKVRHATLDSFHALKIVMARDHNQRARLLREGRAQSNLHHPNVVEVVEVLNHDSHPALVMEFIDGPDLQDWIDDLVESQGAPPMSDALRVFRGIVRGLRHAHRKGMIHRDLKPGNILMAPGENGERVAKIADFGLVKDSEGDGRVVTRSGIAMGTPEYMAPEQMRDAAKVDHRADLFSLGCVLYLLVTGKQAFAGRDILDVFNKVATGEYEDPVALRPDIPVHIEKLVRRLLEPEPEDRPQDCDAVLWLLDGKGSKPPRSAVDTLVEGAGATVPEGGGLGGLDVDRTMPPSPVEDWGANTSAEVFGGFESEVATQALPVEEDGSLATRWLVAVALLSAIPPMILAFAGVAWLIVNASPASAPPAPDLGQVLPPAGQLPVEPEPAPAPEEPDTDPPAAPPAAPAPAPAPVPVQTTRREAPTGARGTLRLEGDASAAWLESGGKRFAASGEIPAGSYTIMVVFPGAEPTKAGSIAIHAGQTRTIQCNSAMQSCRVR